MAEEDKRLSFNQLISGEKEKSPLEAAQEKMTEQVKELMAKRYSKDPKKADSEAEKFLQKFLQNVLKLQEKEKKTKTQRLQEEAKAQKELAQMQYDSATNFKDKLKASGEFMKGSLKEAALNLKNSLQDSIAKLIDIDIDQYMDTYSKYQSSINARLQTFDKYQGEAFNNLTKLVRKNLAASPYVKQEEMLESLNNLVKQGISYNLEQRAFLDTITDKIVTTFDALDETLLSMIRLQQQDTTQARMGMEAYLTKYLNSTYQDSSYLNSVYDTVTSNLFEAESQLGRNASIELEYVIQKWLGSMYSVGVSSDFISKISQGLGYLGSGDVESLQSDSSLQNLLVMASNRAGVEYSKILTEGLNSDTANKLLKGIAQYVQEISQSNSNQVVRSQYADIFGMSISDMTAMLNLKNDLGTISQGMISYSDAISELNAQLKAVGSRMNMKEMMDNVFSNFMAGVAGNIAGNTGSYITWKVTDLVEKATGGIAIPAVSILGNMVDLETTVTGLMKAGIVGVNVIGQIGNIIGGLSNGGSLNLANWGGTESTARGGGFGAITKGYSSTTSTSAYIGSSSGSDIYSSSVTAAKDQAKTENKGSEEEEESITDLTKSIIQILSSWSSSGDTYIKAKVINSIADPVATQSTTYGLTTSGLA